MNPVKKINKQSGEDLNIKIMLLSGAVGQALAARACPARPLGST